MNKYLFILLMALSTTAYSQNYDSLRQVIHEISVEQNRIKLNLQLSHEQYSTGTLFIGMGLGLSAIGTILKLNTNDPGPMAPAMIVAGGVSTMIGCIIQIDSHKWIRRAGKRSK